MIKGISQNTHPEATNREYIYWAKNAILNEKLDAAINEKGNLISFHIANLNISFICGIAVITKYIVIFYKSQGKDSIAVIDEVDNTITIKVERTDLNFNILYPIAAKLKFNSNNELIAAFVQENETPKYINLDTATSSDSLNYYNLFPISFNTSNIVAEVIDGGNLQNGAYFVTFQYISVDRTRSNFTTISKPIYVTNTAPNNTYIAEKGSQSGTTSNKAIRITLPAIDTSYAKIAVAIISRISGVVSQKLIKEVSITGSTLSFVFGGNENIGNITLEELVTDNIRYIKAKHITTINDQLILADVATSPSVDYQALANATTIQWLSTIDVVDTFKTSAKYKDGNRKTFAPDEVYAFYQQFEQLDGSFSDWFHIPGRLVTVGEKGDSSLATGGLQINGRAPKIYELQDTCSFISALSAPSGIEMAYGEMGAWENTNELYPTSYGVAYAGLPVRHHKFPSIQFLAENAHHIGNTYGIENLSFLDIRVTNNAIDYNVVKGYRIGYAKRTLADVGVLGIGLTIFGASPSIDDAGPVDTNTVTSSAGNFNIDSQNGTDDNFIINKNYLRFNSFDIFQDRPALAGVYLRNYVKLTATKLASTAASYEGGPTYGQVHPGSGSHNMVSYFSNFLERGPNKVTRGPVSSADQVRKLSEQLYLPNNVRVSQSSIVIDNLGQEETVFAKIEGSPALALTMLGALGTHTNNSYNVAAMGEPTYLAGLKNAKSDFFLDFENQTIVVSPNIFRAGTTNDIDNIGDYFVGAYSYAMLAKYNKNVNPTTDETQRVVNFKQHISVGRHNVGMRYQKLGDYSSYFYPDMGTFTVPFAQVDKYWFYGYSRNSEWNQFLYDKDYSIVNDFETFSVYNRDVPNEDKYNYRLIRSLKASRENSLEDGWKTFKIADYFDTVRTKGEIINIEAWGNDAIIIHHRAAIFRTRDKAVLKTNLLSVTLGSGDIFELEPREERATNEGTGGTQHRFSCKLTDQGYFYVDAEVGIAYLYNGEELKDISKGLRLFFQVFMKSVSDNPFRIDLIDRGIVSTYDQLNKRILLSHKAVSEFTVSYDLLKQEWSSAHDFIPEYMFNTRTSMYSIKSNNLYTHNIGERGNYYGVVYPFYVDFIVNDAPNTQKILASIDYICKVLNSDGSNNPRKSLTSVTIWNDQYCTGKIVLTTNETSSLFSEANLKVVDEYWRFNSIKDAVDDPSNLFVDTLLKDSRPIAGNLKTPAWYDAEPVRGKYFIVRLEYSNIENKEVHLRELNPNRDQDSTIRKSKA